MLSTITVEGYQTTPINYTLDLLLRKFLMTIKLILYVFRKRGTVRGFAKLKKIKKSKNNLEVGGWVQVPFG